MPGARDYRVWDWACTSAAVLPRHTPVAYGRRAPAKARACPSACGCRGYNGPPRRAGRPGPPTTHLAPLRGERGLLVRNLAGEVISCATPQRPRGFMTDQPPLRSCRADVESRRTVECLDDPGHVRIRACNHLRWQAKDDADGAHADG